MCGWAEFVGQEMITLKPVKKNEQFTHWYGPEWWSARGIKRANVGTQKYPVPRRVRKEKRVTVGVKGKKIMKRPLGTTRNNART